MAYNSTLLIAADPETDAAALDYLSDKYNSDSDVLCALVKNPNANLDLIIKVTLRLDKIDRKRVQEVLQNPVLFLLLLGEPDLFQKNQPFLEAIIRSDNPPEGILEMALALRDPGVLRSLLNNRTISVEMRKKTAEILDEVYKPRK